MEDSEQTYKIGVILRNMGLASLLTFLVPMIAFWFVALTIQLVVVSRKAFEKTNTQEYKHIFDYQLVISIVGSIASIAIIFMICIPVYELYLSGISYDLEVRVFYQRFLIVGSVLTAGVTCMLGVVFNSLTWISYERLLKSNAYGDVLQKGMNGVKRGKVAQILALVAIIIVIVATLIVNYQIENIGYLLGSSDPLDRLIYFSGITILFGIGGILSLVYCSLQITGFFTTGSAFLKIGRHVDDNTLSPQQETSMPSTPVQPTISENVFIVRFCHNCGEKLGEGTGFRYCPYCAEQLVKVQ
ncbi:MAG: zinc ribbon domain-containing protein [Candidatus Hodarchaeota archaeon]